MTPDPLTPADWLDLNAAEDARQARDGYHPVDALPTDIAEMFEGERTLARYVDHPRWFTNGTYRRAVLRPYANLEDAQRAFDPVIGALGMALETGQLTRSLVRIELTKTHPAPAPS